MSDLPWFPLWVADFTNSRAVRTMTPAQVGVYILLLCSQWEDGPIPLDESLWPGLTNHADPNDIRTVVERSFVKRSTGYENERLEGVRKQQQTRRFRQSEAGRKAGLASAKSRGHKVLRTTVQRSLNDGPTIQSQSQIKELIPSVSTRKPVGRWRFCPDDFQPNEGHVALAAKLKLDLAQQLEAFKDHEFKDPKTDANRAFSRWLRNANTFNGHQGNGKQSGGKGGYRDPSAGIDYKALQAELGE